MIRNSSFRTSKPVADRAKALLTPTMIMLATIAMAASGCCGPIGPGCVESGCYDCDGTYTNPIPYGPLDSFRNLKRNLICGGGGCGETYYGEWISTPPDCVDPCCDDQWVGGAVKARPFCWQPGALLGACNFYGGRFCSGAESSVPCDCGEVCDGGCDCAYYEGEYFEDEYYGEVIGETGCTSCAGYSAKNAGTSRMAQRTSYTPSRNSVQARRDPQVQKIRR